MFFARHQTAKSFLSKEEETTLQSIVVASENNPRRPEFPPGRPKFPATPTYRIEVPGFANVWLKDESVNPTGTHKDRLAWEIVVTYRYFLEAKRDGLVTGSLPMMSIISSGSAAIAIQSLLRQYRLPNLKVLVDEQTDPKTVALLRSIDCETYKTNLGNKMLDWRDILRLTFNNDGFDITSSEALDPTIRFYDWMSYEIINNNPDYCFIPFGTGNLYENVLNISKKEITAKIRDPRFTGEVEKLRHCNFMGATTDDPNSKAAEKLYSPHLPFAHYNEQWIRLYQKAGYCGQHSDVHIIEEKSLDQALELARSQKITCEPSAIAGLALMLQTKDSLPRDKKMLIVNTGKAHLPNQTAF